MDFKSGLKNLTSGRAIKRPSMVGYVERVMVTAAESAPSAFVSTTEYTINQKVSYGGKYYKAKGTTTAGTLPTVTASWDEYTLAPEEYKIVFHKKNGTTYDFFYNPTTTRTDATDLILNKELLTHITADDWFEGLAADFAEAANSSSGNDW